MPRALGRAGEALFLAIALLPDARRGLTAYLLLFLAGALLSIFAARSLSASGLGFLLLCAAAFRLTLLLDKPDLSDDVDEAPFVEMLRVDDGRMDLGNGGQPGRQHRRPSVRPSIRSTSPVALESETSSSSASRLMVSVP